MLSRQKKHTAQKESGKHTLWKEIQCMIPLWLFWIVWGMIWLAESICIISKEGFSLLLFVTVPFSAGFFILLIQSAIKAKNRADRQRR